MEPGTARSGIALPNRISIDLSALAHNLRQVRRLVGTQAKIMAVVKADAYGHGLLPVARHLVEHGAYCLGVAHVSEGVFLRDRGIASPIVLLSGVRTQEECRKAVSLGLTAVLYDPEAADMLDCESRLAGKRTAVHVKVDTGMGRLGIPWDRITPWLERFLKCGGLVVEALMSHLSSADEPDRTFTEEQIRRFAGAVEQARSMGLELPLNSLANSAGVMAHGASFFEMVRPGIMLYGGLPSPGFASPVPLRPVMHLRGRVLQVRELPHSTPVGYGRTYATRGAHRVAVVSAGYADGLPRRMSNRGRILIGGKRVPVIGTVCMNQTICDIGVLPRVSAGDEVVFLGSQGEEEITGDDIARWADTISYEVFCAVGRSGERNYQL